MSELLVEHRGDIRVITINRPHVRNALDLAVARAIASAIDDFDNDPKLRVAILTGSDGHFSAGMDLKAFAAGETPAVDDRGLAGIQYRGPTKPLIAAVEGYAVGGGLELALCCDLIVAARDARLGIPEVKRGLIAAGGGLVRLSRRLPYPVALRMALTGETIDGTQAAAYGLSQLAESGGALTGALELAATIAANSPLAVAASKAVLATALGVDEAVAWSRQEPYRVAVVESADAAEGARAFVEKRLPIWTSAVSGVLGSPHGEP